MAKYRVNHDVTVNGDLIFKVGDSVEGALTPKKNPDGTTGNVLYIKKDSHKVVIPEKWLDEDNGTTSTGPVKPPVKKRTPVLVWATPVAGLIVGLAIAKHRNGTARDYFGWGILGLAVGCIPAVLYFRSNMERMAKAAASVYGNKQAEKKSRSSSLVDSVSLINKTQNGKELDATAKTNLQAIVEGKNFTQDEYKMLKEYITLSNAISIYGDDLSSLSKDDQQKVQSQIKKLDTLFEKIKANAKTKSFIDEVFGSQEQVEQKEAA